MSHFAEMLKSLREERGLSQRELAEKAGLSQKAISFWELGVKEPTIGSFEKLCAALNVTCNVFFDQKPAKRKK